MPVPIRAERMTFFQCRNTSRATRQNSRCVKVAFMMVYGSRMLRTSIRICETANMPMSTGMTLKPDWRSAMPKSKRGMPSVSLRPTQESSRPSAAEMKPLISDLWEMETMQLRVNRTSEKYSQGPKSRAKVLSGGARSTRQKKEKMPPRKAEKTP